MQEISTTIDIDSPPEDVWNVLMDFDAYEEWNPFIRSIKGAPASGEQLAVVLGASGKKPMKFSPIVQESEAPSHFGWLGSVGTKGIFDGYHHFELEPTHTGTRFRQYEEFTGVAVLVLLPAIRKSTTRGFEEMNQALKARVENGL
jgi:hypothetical protein